MVSAIALHKLDIIYLNIACKHVSWHSRACLRVVCFVRFPLYGLLLGPFLMLPSTFPSIPYYWEYVGHNVSYKILRSMNEIYRMDLEFDTHERLPLKIILKRSLAPGRWRPISRSKAMIHMKVLLWKTFWHDWYTIGVDRSTSTVSCSRSSLKRDLDS
jgi:hypothetical protein